MENYASALEYIRDLVLLLIRNNRELLSQCAKPDLSRLLSWSEAEALEALEDIREIRAILLLNSPGE